MFGYVEIDKPELKIREYELFRGYYCSLCKSLGRRYGQISRFTLTYDLTFLYVLLDALNSLPAGGKMQSCIAHPIKKSFVVNSNIFAEYTSDMNIILMYYNLMDKWEDERKLLGKTGTLVLRRAFNKAQRLYPKKAKNISDQLKTLSRIEKQGCDSTDEAAESFALIMSEIFNCDHIEGEVEKKALSWLGYNLGRWIYILDAYDDIEKDNEKSNYNPLLEQYKYDGKDIKEFKESIKDKVNFSLTYSLSEVEKAYSLLEIEKNKGIMDNILYSGLILKTDSVLQGKREMNEKRSV